MKNLLIAAVFISMLTMQAFAQSSPTDTLRMSLQQCIDYAKQNQTTVKNAILDAEISHRKSQEIYGYCTATGEWKI
jgi:hypothetical protein